MKYLCITTDMHVLHVAPFVGAWIEIGILLLVACCVIVAPFVGAWIEIIGLTLVHEKEVVAPFVGAWIEINNGKHDENGEGGRSLRGSVD